MIRWTLCQLFLSFKKNRDFFRWSTRSNSASLFTRSIPASGSLSAKTEDEISLEMQELRQFLQSLFIIRNEVAMFPGLHWKNMSGKYKSRFPRMEFRGPFQNQLLIWLIFVEISLRCLCYLSNTYFFYDQMTHFHKLTIMICMITIIWEFIYFARGKYS